MLDFLVLNQVEVSAEQVVRISPDRNSIREVSRTVLPILPTRPRRSLDRPEGRLILGCHAPRSQGGRRRVTWVSLPIREPTTSSRRESQPDRRRGSAAG